LLASTLAGRSSGVNVVLAVVIDWASDELGVAVVSNVARAADGETGSRSSTTVTLELSGWWCEDAASAVSVGDAAVVQAVASSVSAAGRTTNTVLAIRKLADGARDTSASSETEAAAGIARKHRSGGSTCSKGQGSESGLHLETKG